MTSPLFYISSLLFFFFGRLNNSDMHFFKLRGGSLRRRIHHEVGSRLRFGECNHFTNIGFASKQHHQSI